MRTTTTSISLLFGALSVIFVTGCDNQVIGGGETGGGSGEGGGDSVTVGSGNGNGTGSGNGSGAGGVVGSVSFYGDELPDSQTGMCDWGDCADNMLFLLADSVGPTCADPYWTPPDDAMAGVEGPDRTEWAFTIGIPVGQQHVGTFALAGNERFQLTEGELMIEGGGGVAVGTGGLGGGNGTLEILSIDATSIRYRVSGVTYNVVSDGEYVATRCGVAQHAFEGAALPAQAGGVTIVVGSETATCSTEIATSCSGDTFQASVTLPSQYLVPGSYSLSDPLITSANCTASPKFLGGTITILSVDDGSIALRFDDVVDHADELQRDLLIERCTP